MHRKLTLFRRVLQVIGLALLMFLPVFNIFRLELASKQFILLGRGFFLGKTYLLVIIFAALITGLVIFSRSLGRVFCGWLCPQNTWAEIGDSFLRNLLRKNKNQASYLVIILQMTGIIAVVLLFCLTLMFYFVPPRQVWIQFVNREFSPLMTIAITKLTVLGLLNMLLIRHSFCWTICPYGFFQRFLTTDSTLKIKFTSAGCNSCGRCDRACFMKLSPRELDVNSCINCANCLVVCAKQAEKRRVFPALNFSLGGRDKKTRPLSVADQKTAAITLLFFLLTGIAIYGFTSNKQLEVVVSKEFRNLASANVDGSVTNQYLLRISTSKDLGNRLEFAVNDYPGDLRLEPDHIILPVSDTREVKLAVTIYGIGDRENVVPLALTATPSKTNMSPERLKLFFYLPGKI